eukprot:Gb_28436 [translate_table: standard]
MDYVSPTPKELDHEVTIEEIQEHFAKHMVNDSLGFIDSRHLAFADQERNMARSSNCLRLAKLHSKAVDYSKTGIPAQIPKNLCPAEYPDFMEKDDKPSYKSKSVLGKLYRSVKELAPQALCISSFTKEVAQKAYDTDLEVEGFDRYLSEALMYKNWYDSKLATLMGHYGVESEADIISGNILSLSRFHDSKKLGDLQETIMLAVNSLRKEARGWFEENIEDSKENCTIDEHFAKASAWYRVTYHPDHCGYGNYEELGKSIPHFISFPWVVHDRLLNIKRRRRARAL